MCVLIVEDELLIRMGTAMVLEDAGHEVVCAADGNEAVELLERHAGRFSALVTDYHMPGALNGGQLVERMRQDYPLIPMYIVSARTSIITESWRQQHHVTLLSKPYEPEDLARLVKQDLASQPS